MNPETCSIQPRPISVIVPTYREVGSLPGLLDRLALLRSGGWDLEVIIVDDDSRDGTEELIESREIDAERLIIRRNDRGLSSAVIRGMDEAQHDLLVVMDADLSHPPEAIPSMVEALDRGADFALGSRYVSGGSTEDGWGVLRWINSKVATWMARPFTTATDPMSGFFCVRRSTVEAGASLDPIGYKIGLEVIVKCGCGSVTEVPIHFSTRRHGESKLTLKVQWDYLVHIARLGRFKYPGLMRFMSFALVGLSGIGVYVGLLALLDLAFESVLQTWLRILIALILSMTWNFIWDRRFAFWYARDGSILRQYLGFVAICTVPVIVNYFVTWSFSETTVLPLAGVIGAVIGSAFGLLFNWIGNRWLVFRRW